jgi:hypothetical protein
MGCGASQIPGGNRPIQSPTNALPSLQYGNNSKVIEPVSALDIANPQPVSALDIANPPRIEVLVHNKEFRTDPKFGALLVTFADLNLLTVLNMKDVTNDAVEWMPEWLKSLDGTTVRIRGYMYPTLQEKEIERFVLVRSNQIMNFGAGTRVDEAIMVSTKPGMGTDYVPPSSQVDVMGRFKIDLKSHEGTIVELYEINGAQVTRVP